MSSITDKVDFVTGLAGTSVLEVVWVTTIPVLLLGLSRVLMSVWNPAHSKRFILEFAMLVIPQVLGLLGVVSSGFMVVLLLVLVVPLLLVAHNVASRRRIGTNIPPESLDMRSEKMPEYA